VGLQDLLVVAVFVVAYGLVSGRLEGTPVTPPMLFVGFGLLAGPPALGLVELDLDNEAVRVLAEATLVLVLFTDAARIDLRVLRREYHLPARLLGIGLPLTVLAGTLAAVVLFDGLELWEAAVLAAVLAPTDAALGQVVVTSPEVPLRVRQGLNVESGLNDGLALPAVTVLVAAAASAEDLGGPGSWGVFAAEQVGYGVLVGVLVGTVGGRLIDAAARRGWMSEAFRQVATLAVAAAAYALSETVGGNGFIAAFTAGLAFGTVARGICQSVYDFTEEEGQLLTLLTFLVFGVAVVGPRLDELTWQVAAYAVLSLTVVRMLPVALSLLGSRMRADTVLFLGWFGPRGLASILFGLLVVEESGVAGADTIFLVMGWTVLLSVLSHGVTAAPLARRYARRIAAHRTSRPAMPEVGPATHIRTRTG
jgi:NhaP-type Na+/H+ or K+/H+ antiporter